MTYQEKIAELEATGLVDGEDFAVHRVHSRAFSVHRRLKGSEFKMFLANNGRNDRDGNPDQERNAQAAYTAALQTCIFPESRDAAAEYFEEYPMAPMVIQTKLLAMAGGSEYVDPKKKQTQGF